MILTGWFTDPVVLTSARDVASVAPCTWVAGPAPSRGAPARHNFAVGIEISFRVRRAAVHDATR